MTDKEYLYCILLLYVEVIGGWRLLGGGREAKKESALPARVADRWLRLRGLLQTDFPDFRFLLQKNSWVHFISFHFIPEAETSIVFSLTEYKSNLIIRQFHGNNAVGQRGK